MARPRHIERTVIVVLLVIAVVIAEGTVLLNPCVCNFFLFSYILCEFVVCGVFFFSLCLSSSPHASAFVCECMYPVTVITDKLDASSLASVKAKAEAEPLSTGLL
jgi:hypothetical protein